MQSINHLTQSVLYSHLVKHGCGVIGLQTLRRHYMKLLNCQAVLASSSTQKQTFIVQNHSLAWRNCSSVSQQSPRPSLQRCTLTSRGIISVSGSDSDMFLQGLLTNDMSFIEAPQTAMYAALLNVQGRILYDTLVYNVSTSEKAYLLECDREVIIDFIKAVSKYKIRKKVVINDVTDAYDVCAIFPHIRSDIDSLTISDAGSSETSTEETKDAGSSVIEIPDPRVNSLGWRRLAQKQSPSTSSVSAHDTATETSEEDYHMTRYRLGVGEGIKDLPPGECFPLESNLVFLGGVCFHKGCYIGQELTARTFHTGVTRKRLMPLIFDREPQAVMPGEKIEAENGKTVGKYRNHVGKYGLGLLRLAEIRIGHAYNIKNKSAESYGVETYMPEWWRKDELSVQSMKQ